MQRFVGTRPRRGGPGKKSLLHTVRWVPFAVGPTFLACHGEQPPPLRSPVSVPTAERASSSPARAVSRPGEPQPWFEVPVYFQALVARAEALAAGPPPPAPPSLPGKMSELTYDEYRSIRFRPARSLWRGTESPIEAQFFHLGFGYQHPVKIHTLSSRETLTPVPYRFSTDLFSYDDAPMPPAEAPLDFAGVRLHTAWNKPEYRDEFIVFQGASYFRTLGRGQVYGLSARGLAVDFGEPTPEEFPRFSELYLVEPRARERFAWILALLESDRLTGAYAFRVEPGDPTVAQVTARLFLRKPVRVLGLAPLTSMYLFGEERPAQHGHFRPEVHDSDTLLLHAKNGEWIARTLRNPPRITVCSFRLDSPAGFGVLQRDRDFSSYQDLEARYQDRPSAWVEPVGDWGPGVVRLLEMPTTLESNDNIALAWVPDEVSGGGVGMKYLLRVGALELERPPGHVVATRIETADMPQVPKHGAARFLVDFSLPSETRSAEELIVDVSADRGQILEQHAEANPHVRGYRASFLVAPAEGSHDIELRAHLRDPERGAITETWSYLWQPQ